MKIELKEKDHSDGYGYDVTVTSNPKNIEKVFDSLEECKDEWVEDGEDFYIVGYVEYQDKINIVDYYGAFINESIDFDDVAEYAGILTSFAKDGDKLYLSIENAGMPYDEEQVKMFFFSDIIDTEEERTAAINKLQGEIKELEGKIDVLKKRIIEIEESEV